MIQKNTLKMIIIEKVARNVLKGKYIKNFAILPETLKKDILIYIINYY